MATQQCKVGASMAGDYYEHAAECPECEAHEAARQSDRGDYIYRLCGLLILGRRILAHPHKAMELAEHIVRIASEGGAVPPGLLRDAAPVGEPAAMPPVEVGDWVTDIEDPQKPYLVRWQREADDINGRFSRFVGEIRKANGVIWRRTDRKGQTASRSGRERETRA